MNKPNINVAVLGAGTVGTQVIRLLQEQSHDLASRAGAQLNISSILVRDIAAPRDSAVDRALLTTDANSAIDGADLVIELMGGIEPARSYVLRALQQGSTVVTGNKALLASHGPELYEAAAVNNTDLYFEATVAGAVPVVYGVRESLAGDRINRIIGVVNGTTNYILDQMDTQGWSYEQALTKAQELGYAEADPTADVDGLDAGAKCAILASLAFHSRVSIDDVDIQGIRDITSEDMFEAAALNHVIKLLAVAERTVDATGAEAIAVRVHPALVPLEHPIAAVRGAFNAIVIEAQAAGRLMFYGQGAGGVPTASAVLGDVVAAASHRVNGGNAPRELNYANLPILSPEKIRSRYLVRLVIDDSLGVLHAVSGVLAQSGISIDTVHQRTADENGVAVLVIATHEAQETEIQAAFQALKQEPVVRKIISSIRMEGN